MEIETNMNDLLDNISSDSEFEDDTSVEDEIKPEKVLNYCQFDFDDVIISRGEDYYNKGFVTKCIGDGNEFTAKVKGSLDDPYIVHVYIDQELMMIDYDCSCPCGFPCKHEYAVLKAISNNDFKRVELKPFIPKEDIDIHSLIEKIPAEEIKEFLLLPVGMENVNYNRSAFDAYFRNYLPVPDYDYYYNELFNKMILEEEYISLVNSDIELINKYIMSNNFVEAFKIIKAIINAYVDSNKLNEDDKIIDFFPKLGMFLRVICRKGDSELMQLVFDWCNLLEKNNFYNNYYLEDIILSLK